MNPPPAISVERDTLGGWSIPGALLELTKPRIAASSVLTAWAGFAAAGAPGGTLRHLALLAGSALAAGGALACNQWWERDTDPLMPRTSGRPLVRGVISPRLALAWSTLLALGGTALLACMFGLSCAAVSAAIIVLYCFIYTPLKRMTHWATEVGSISGALPPLLGSAAAGDLWAVPAVLLAAVLLFWQMPHFFSIGWIYRADYKSASLPLLPTLDDTGAQAARWSVGYSIPLALVLLLPWPCGWAGPAFGVCAAGCAAAILWTALSFMRAAGDRRREARRLFRTTLITLPLIVAALLLDGRQ